MTAVRRREKPQTIPVEEIQFSGVFYGSKTVVYRAIRKVTDKWQYDHHRHAYLIPRRHIDAVCVELERAGHTVDIRMSPW